MAQSSIATDLLKGALAGAAATWVMNQATTWMYEHEADAAKARENDARGDETAYASAAGAMAGVAGYALEKDQRAQAGQALHWIAGIGAGAFYGVARKRWPSVAGAVGLPFGAGFYLAIDEIMNPALGFTPGPTAFPWQTHARGLGGHLVFGLALEVLLGGLDRSR